MKLKAEEGGRNAIEGIKYTVDPVLKDHPIGHKNMIC